MVIMESTCSNGHSRKWTSQPIHNKLPLGNLFLSGGILFSGSSPSSVLKCLKHSGIATFTERTYRRIQTAYLVPAVKNIWKINQEKALETCLGRNVKLGGDARCCSPGHTAKYGSYSLMDLETGKVLEEQLVQVTEVKNSYSMELEGLKRGLASLKSKKLSISNLTTDRHVQVKKYMSTEETQIKHWFDVWHMAKACITKIEKSEGMITVPSFHGSVRCVNKIEVDRGSIIEMNITGIDGNETAGFNCPGSIHIHDGAPPSVELSTLSCSNDGPVKVESTSNVVYITYTGQRNPDRSTVIARYIYKSVYRKYFRRETGIILLPESEVDKTKECQFFVSVSKLKKIRLYFHREHSRLDNDTCSSIMNVTDGDTSSIILYSGCVFSNLPEFIETTSNAMTIIVFLNDQLNTSRPLGFYTAYEATTLPIKKIIIASLGLVILFLTGNISVWIWMDKKKTNTSGRSISRQRDFVIDNNTVYDIQEENIDNPYEEVE